MFHDVVYRRIWGLVGSLINVFLQIYWRLWQWKKIENRLKISMNLVSHFLADGVSCIRPPRFLAECCKRQLNQGSFVLLYFRLFTFSDVYWVCLSVFSCTVLFVSISQVIGCDEDRLRNDLYCVEWGVKLFSNQASCIPAACCWRRTPRWRWWHWPVLLREYDTDSTLSSTCGHCRRSRTWTVCSSAGPRRSTRPCRLRPVQPRVHNYIMLICSSYWFYRHISGVRPLLPMFQ